MQNQPKARPAAGASAVLLAAAALLSALPAPASAAIWYWGPGGEVAAPVVAVPVRPRRIRPARPHLPEPKLTEKEKPQGPLIITISIQRQELRLYDVNGLFAESPVSTGMAGHTTPLGIFSILEKQKWHRSNIYSGAPMPYMQRITWSGVALHQGVLPGYPASHGCIRMPAAFAIKLWAWTQRGARVIITPGEIAPENFVHPKLLAKMQDAPDVAALAKTTGNGPAETASATTGQAEPALRSELRLATLTHTAAADADVTPMVEARTEPLVPQAGAASADAAKTEAAASAEPAASVQSAEKSQGSQAGTSTNSPADDAGSEATAQATTSSATEAAANITAASPTASAAAPQGEAAAVPPSASPSPVAASPSPSMAVAPADTSSAAPQATDPHDVPTVIGPKRTGHVAVFISRKERRLYVRQNFSPVFDVPVAITDGDKPLGTFVFTARGDKDDNKALHWSVVAMPAVIHKTVTVPSNLHRGKIRTTIETSLAAATTTPAEALDRIGVPDTALERIAQMIKPGGSIVISDQGLGDETGLGTDFIVPLR